MMKKTSKTVEDHFNAIFSQKERSDYEYDFHKMGVKDRKIAQSLLRYGVKNKKCLDVGPGTGRWLMFLKQHGASYLGAIDIASQSLERYASFCTKTQKADLETSEFAFDSNFFDIVISFEVIEHLRDPAKYLLEIQRVTKKGGMVLMSTPNIVSLISRLRMLAGALPVAISSDRTHISFFRQKDIVRLLTPFDMKPQFIPTSISLNPFYSKSKFYIPSNKFISSLDDNLLFFVRT